MSYLLRTLLRSTGFDIVRHRTTAPTLSFLTNYDIHTVIDAGANIGQFAKEVRMVLPTAHIHSFEPMQDCFTTLTKAFEHDAHFTAHQYALGDTSGTAEIQKHTYSPSSSLLPSSTLHDTAFPHTKEFTTETVEVRTLDSLLDIRTLTPSILFKLDVQGYEDKVLRGAQTILKASSIVLIETSFHALYEGQPLFHDIYTRLVSQGFSYHGSVQQKRHPATHEPLFEDSIFVRSTSA